MGSAPEGKNPFAHEGRVRARGMRVLARAAWALGTPADDVSTKTGVFLFLSDSLNPAWYHLDECGVGTSIVVPVEACGLGLRSWEDDSGAGWPISGIELEATWPGGARAHRSATPDGLRR